MKIKTYRAPTASAARTLVRQDLGDEAVILSARKVKDPEALRRGEQIEMTAAIDLEVEPLKGLAERATNRQPPRSGESSGAPFAQPGVAKLERRLDDLQRLVQQLNANALAPDELVLEEVYRAVHAEMVSNDVAPSLAIQVVRAVRKRFGAHHDRSEVASEIQQTLKQLLPKHRHPPRRIQTLVGPTGVGKTTTAAKLAALSHLTSRSPVAMISCDTYRVAAIDQLRAYAAALDAQFEAAHGVEELDAALARCEGAETIVLDTEGRSQRDLEKLKPLFRYLERRPDVENHLVVAANTKPRDLVDTIDRFRVAAPENLIFTKIDETGSYGPVLSESIRSGLPVSYLCTGQRVPETLMVATPEKLAELAVSTMG